MRQLLLIGLLAAPIIWAYKNFSDQLKYSIKQIKLKSVSLTRINFDLVIELINPTSTEITVKSIVFDILYQSSVLATGQQLNSFVIKPQAKNILTINAKSTFVALTQSIYSALQLFIQQKIKPVVKITGLINFNQGSLNIDTTKQIG